MFQKAREFCPEGAAYQTPREILQIIPGLTNVSPFQGLFFVDPNPQAHACGKDMAPLWGLFLLFLHIGLEPEAMMCHPFRADARLPLGRPGWSVEFQGPVLQAIHPPGSILSP